MTIEEAIKYFKNNNERIRSTAIDENRTSKFMKETIDANNMAIKSFESWDKVKDDIRQMYFTKPITVRNEVLDIINKHLEEIEND